MGNKSGFYGFLVGGLVGAAVAMLYSPRRGEETRQILMDESIEIRDQVLKSIQDAQRSAMSTLDEAQAQLVVLNQETKDRLGKLQEIGMTTLEEQKESLDKGVKEVQEVITADVPDPTKEK
jgi:gas vesicle protein